MDIRLAGLHAKKVVYLEDVRLPFDDQLVYIRGINRDSSPINPTGNAVGKTLLFNCLPNVYYGTQPMAVKKNSKREMLGKGSSIEITQYKGDDEWRIVQTASSYKFFKNGEDQRIRTVPLQKKKLQELFPLSEVEFYTYCWLSTQKPFPFQAGKDLERLESLVQMFRLDKFEPVRVLAARRLRTLKDNEIRVSVVLSQMQELREKIAKNQKVVKQVDPVRLKATLATLESEKTEVSTKLGSLHVELQTLRKLLEVESSLDEYRGSYKHKSPPDARKSELLRARKSMQAYEKWLHSKEVYDRQVARLTKELYASEETKIDPARAKAGVDKYSVLVPDLEAAMRGANNLRLQYKELTAELAPIQAKLKDFDPESVPQDLDDQLASARTTVKLKKFLHEHKSGDVCPTCMSKIDRDGLSKLVAAAEKRLVKLLAMESSLELLAEKSRILKRRKALSYVPGRYEEVSAEYTAASKKLKTFEAAYEAHKHARSIEKQIAALDVPGDPPSVPAEIEQDIDAEIELCDNIISALSARAALGGSVQKAARVKAKIAEAKLQMSELKDTEVRLLKRQATHSSSLESYRLAKTLLDTSKQELAALTAEEKELSADLPSKIALEALVKAYGPKGIRTLAAESICTILEQNMNNYRELVFHEPFQFSVRASEDGLAIRVDRGHGFASDVRLLSGAESNSYRLLFLISVLSMIPASRRPNFVVLDEPTSHQHIATRQLILDRYIPVLRQVIPNIFFVSNVGDSSPDSKELFLIKENGSTRITDQPNSVVTKTVKKRQSKTTRRA